MKVWIREELRGSGICEHPESLYGVQRLQRIAGALRSTLFCGVAVSTSNNPAPVGNWLLPTVLAARPQKECFRNATVNCGNTGGEARITAHSLYPLLVRKARQQGACAWVEVT